MLTEFKDFMQDENAYEMFVTGRAGTGKTTGLTKLVEQCQNSDTDYVVCAFTHKACNVLASALPQGAKIQTLHKHLKKRPTINTQATNLRHIEVSRQHGNADEVSVLFVDEYSMVGEQDLMSIREIENLKVVWLGDPNQLPPVDDMQSVSPHGDYQVTLTKVYRQSEANPLMDTLDCLVRYIEGEKATPLEENENFTRNQDIAEWYDNDAMSDTFDGVMLAYTNRRVQELNAYMQGRDEPIVLDKLFCPSNRMHYRFHKWLDASVVFAISKPYGGDLARGSKYYTLEHLATMQVCKFVEVLDEDDEPITLAIIFGHYNYKLAKEKLSKAAAESNRALEQKYKGTKAAVAARENPDDPLAKKRTKAWRDFLTFNDCVACLDFTHAMTVHKCQGSTYKTVYLDTQDLAIAASIDYMQYLKLMYVAISRATNYVITN